MENMYRYIFLLILVVQFTSTQDMNHQLCMLVPTSIQECFQNFKGKPIKDMAGKISCLQDLLWNSVPDTSLDDKDLSFVWNLSRAIVGEAGKRPKALSFKSSQDGAPRPDQYLYPASGYRIRKEYRTLTPVERGRFHRALKRLYMDGIIDAFAKIHAQASNKHHGGASFLPWHRIYLIMFEEALRLYDQRVSLPYWASIFDDEMDNPVNSILWTPKYFGNGDGIVTSGPAAYWVTAQGSLERAFGKKSTLFKREQIQQVLSQCRMTNITSPTSRRRFDFEVYHGGPHVWVGGDMEAFATTGYDPVFYMHHAYVDFIWEQFRSRQRIVCSVDPSTDYPNVPPGDSNHQDATMTGFEQFSNKDGIKPHWTNNWYSYEPEPTCPDCCPDCPEPAPLICDPNRYICVSRSRLVDEYGRIKQDVALELSQRSPEKDSVQSRPPRNRGRVFDAPPSDGRTVFTAIPDAIKAASQVSGIQ